MSSNSIKKFVKKLLSDNTSKKIEGLITKAKELGLPEKDVNEALLNLEYNEFGLAFDIIVEQLFEFEIPIDQEFYDLAIEVCQTMKLSKDNYLCLKELIRL